MCKFSLLFFGTAKSDYVMRARQMFSLLLAINYSVIVGWFVLLPTQTNYSHPNT